MNIYFLVEGKRTEMKVYPKWLSYLVPQLQRVNAHQNVKDNNYFMFSGNGFPSLPHNHLRNAIEDINNTKECVAFYNVKSDDPELMEKMPDFEGSTSIFHSSYLQQLLSERNIRYSKNNPQGVIEAYFLENLINRNQKTGHIQSFKSFIDFCEKIKMEMSK